jgi:ATP-binding cassette subfamily B (MDR/TAP) protein 1
LKRRIAFFDSDKNSPGTLTSRLSVDSTQIRQIVGGEMALQVVAVFGIIGSVAIAFAFGWKLALVGVATIMPLSMMAGYYRVHLERYFETLNAEVFAETAQFGSEAISLFRTCISNVMEDKIIERFEVLLAEHLRKAVKQSRFSTIVFAFSESADMFCQPLFFWYGGKLLADRSYDLISFFVIYMAVVQVSNFIGCKCMLIVFRAVHLLECGFHSRPSKTNPRK